MSTTNNIPTKYKWLENEPGPVHLTEAIKFLGKDKVPASGNRILQTWNTEIGTNAFKDYDADAVSWNGLFLALLATRSGWQLPEDFLWALSWNSFGTASPQPMLGDVLTFTRPSGGAAGIYVGEDKSSYHIIGARDADAVTLHRLDKRKCYRFRRPPYTTLPLNVRVVRLTVGGGLV